MLRHGFIETAPGNPSAGGIKNLHLGFNAFDPGSPDYCSQQNKQRGLSYLALGRTCTGLSSGETVLIEMAPGNPSAGGIKNSCLEFNTLVRVVK